TDVFDLHTIPPKQVRAVVEKYLYQAHEKGIPVVRINHGKGIGVQREIVRKVLERTDFVLDWTDAPPEAGGLGATIARLRLEYRSAFLPSVLCPLPSAYCLYCCPRRDSSARPSADGADALCN